MSEWISAMEALKRVKAEGLTEEDLIEWASQGSLRARAQSGTFNLDDPPKKRLFPSEPPLDHGQSSTRVSWPDIPTDYWAKSQVKVLWGSGTCKATVTHWKDDQTAMGVEIVKLFGLTFSEIGLNSLLTEIMSPPVKATQSSSLTWQPKQVVRQQTELFQYFETPALYRHFVNQELRPGEHHLKYCEWVAKVPSRNKPFERTAFNKWRKRYDEGHRIDGHKWV